LDEVDGIERLRISSIEPNLLKNETIDFVASSKTFVPHFHIPLQSGSDTLLKLMKRRYLSNIYVNRVTQIKKVMPHACIGVDVIVGFPGETHEQFQDTYDLLMELPITHFHVFPYSKRKNTVAEKFDNHIPHDVKKRRVRLLIELGERKYRQFCESQIGQTSNVLFERKNQDDHFEGYTENFIKVEMSSEKNLSNQVHLAKLVNLSADRVQVQSI